MCNINKELKLGIIYLYSMEMLNSLFLIMQMTFKSIYTNSYNN